MEWYVCVYFFFSFAEIGWATGRPNRKRWTTNYLNRRSVTVSRPSCRRGPCVSQRHHVDAAMGRHWSVSAGGWDPSGLMRTTVALSDHLLQPLGLPPPPNDAHVSINANFFTSQREKYVVDIKNKCFLFCTKQDPNSMKSASQAAKCTFFFYSPHWSAFIYFWYATLQMYFVQLSDLYKLIVSVRSQGAMNVASSCLKWDAYSLVYAVGFANGQLFSSSEVLHPDSMAREKNSWTLTKPRAFCFYSSLLLRCVAARLSTCSAGNTMCPQIKSDLKKVRVCSGSCLNVDSISRNALNFGMQA